MGDLQARSLHCGILNEVVCLELDAVDHCDDIDVSFLWMNRIASLILQYIFRRRTVRIVAPLQNWTGRADHNCLLPGHSDSRF